MKIIILTITEELFHLETWSWCLIISFWDQRITWNHFQWSHLSQLTCILKVYRESTTDTKKTFFFTYLFTSYASKVNQYITWNGLLSCDSWHIFLNEHNQICTTTRKFCHRWLLMCPISIQHVQNMCTKFLSNRVTFSYKNSIKVALVLISSFIKLVENRSTITLCRDSQVSINDEHGWWTIMYP